MPSHENLAKSDIVMEDQSINDAKARINAALVRIEKAAASASSNSGASAKLVARHEAMREKVSASLGELDALIEKLER